MKYIKRNIENQIEKDLLKKMIFISGPRQSGKTTLAKKILSHENKNNIREYMNWDSNEDRESIIKEKFPLGKGMLVLDEIHKYSRWRQVVKGLYDKRNEEIKILVTGSGKLDYYRYGGDSLQGRYHFYRLYPLSLDELNKQDSINLIKLLEFGGFPEQFINSSERETKRWSREYRSRIIYDDINTLENVKDIALIENLVLRLPDLVGSPLSINSLRNDLQVSHHTVSRWIQILENIYMIFRVYPFNSSRLRAVKKEAKHYHYDWMTIEEESYRFENLIACHLLKWCHFQQDFAGEDIELKYFRDIDRREVDFVICKNQTPIKFIECKLKFKEINPALKYIKQRFPESECTQISLHSNDAFVNKDNINVMPAYIFLNNLYKYIHL